MGSSKTSTAFSYTGALRNGAAWFWGRFWSVQGMGGINMLLENWKAAGSDVWKIVVKTLYSKQSVCR